MHKISLFFSWAEVTRAFSVSDRIPYDVSFSTILISESSARQERKVNKICRL